MRIDGVIWMRHIVDKLASKHQVTPEEVEETLNNEPKIRFMEKGERKGKMFTSRWDKSMKDATLQFSSSTNCQKKR